MICMINVPGGAHFRKRRIKKCLYSNDSWFGKINITLRHHLNQFLKSQYNFFHEAGISVSNEDVEYERPLIFVE